MALPKRSIRRRPDLAGFGKFFKILSRERQPFNDGMTARQAVSKIQNTRKHHDMPYQNISDSLSDTQRIEVIQHLKAA